MKKIGNLFELAEKQLQKEQKEGIIPCYTLSDILEYAILIRRWLDYNPKKYLKVMKLSRKELLRHRVEINKRYYQSKKVK